MQDKYDEDVARRALTAESERKQREEEAARYSSALATYKRTHSIVREHILHSSALATYKRTHSIVREHIL